MEKINDKATSNLSTKSLDFLWDDLNQYFKKPELRSKESQYKAFKHKNYYISYFNDEIRSAFALWWDFDSLVFCEYIVVSGDNRGIGMGSRLLEHLAKLKKQIVLEVGKGSELALFYVKNKFVLNDYSYNAIPLNGKDAEKYDLFSYSEPLTKEEYDYFWYVINEPEYQF